ncbi:hypothetical protein [Sulfurimonas sp.]
MSQQKIYTDLINKVFDDFQCKKYQGNNIANALISNKNFSNFKQSFIDKLQFIYTFINDDNSDSKWKKTLYDILNSIANEKNYEGAWAEFCALYEFIKVANYGYKLDSEVDIQATNTFGQYYNKTVTNYDLVLGENLYIDIKIFSDKNTRVIQEWCNQVTSNTNVTILPEISYHLEIEQVTLNAQKIKQEMQNAIESKKDIYKSSIIDTLTYKIQKGSGVLMATSEFNPYLFAKNEHKLIFKHFNKLHKKMPSILVYVLHSWYSDKSLTSGFQDTRNIVFRSIARRLFMQYKNKKIQDFDNLPRNATQYLSGIIFIVDNSIKNEKNQVYFYTNPNAKNKMYHILRDHIKDILAAQNDWFEYDNY